VPEVLISQSDLGGFKDLAYLKLVDLGVSLEAINPAPYLVKVSAVVSDDIPGLAYLTVEHTDDVLRSITFDHRRTSLSQ